MRYALPILVLVMGLMYGLHNYLRDRQTALTAANLGEPEPLLQAAIAAGETDEADPADGNPTTRPAFITADVR